jgi:phospholipid/cholesterol/gamma-HCH transport system ATP-binding protein
VSVSAESGTAIEVSGVIKDLGGTRILDGVELTARRGAITVLLGPSGAGKTVTIKHIVGLMQPTAGNVRVLGRDLGAIPEEELYELRRRMAVVLQGTLPFTCGLFYSIDVYENVAYALRQRTRLSEAEIERTTLEHLELVGMRDAARLMPDQLSAGMTKRVALARALALEAELVIIDDFDSGIDGVRLSLLCDLIRDTQTEAGTSFLVTTHDIGAARKLADDVALIHEGRIVAADAASAVLASPDPLVHQFVTGATSGPVRLSDL